jgi:hypothetical protein
MPQATSGSEHVLPRRRLYQPHNAEARDRIQTFLPVRESRPGWDTETTVLSYDPDTSDQTVILKHIAGSTWGQPVCKHAYWEECYILEVRLFDESLGKWFDAGHYCCRPPGMVHGPYRGDADIGCKEICYVRYEK